METDIKRVFREMEGVISMSYQFPASKNDIELLKIICPALPKEVQDIYRTTDGVGINLPDVEIYPIEKVLNTAKTSGDDRYIVIGDYSFGDEIVIDKQDGHIAQIDHETGDEFLTWNNLVQFFEECLQGYK